MLSRQDFALYFQAIPRNFELKINGIGIKCNKQLICGFSTRVQNEVSKAPSIDSLSFDIAVDPAVAENVINFFHGGELKIAKDLTFQFFYFSAFMGIESVSRRVSDCDDIFSPETFQERFQLLSAFKEFCRPIIVFLRNNPQLFRSFIRDNVLQTDTVASLIENGTNLFESTDEQFDFITKLGNPSLFSAINAESLSPMKREELMKLDPETKTHCKYFRLISTLLTEKRRRAGDITNLSKQITQLQTELETLKNAPVEDASELELHRNLRKTLHISDRLFVIAACLPLLTVKSDHGEALSRDLESVRAKGSTLMKILNKFYSTGGWLLFPGQSASSMDVRSSWEEDFAKLEQYIALLDPPRQALEIYSTKFYGIAESLRNLCNTI